MPIGIQEIRSDGCRKFLEPLRSESHVLQLIDVSGVSLYLGVKLSDAVFGSCHPRCELVFFNQAFGEAVDESLKRVLLFETQDFESLRILYGSNSFSPSLNSRSSFSGFLRRSQTSRHTAASRNSAWICPLLQMRFPPKR